MSNYPKGSEWRKWDLHIHAPGGKLFSGYKAKGTTSELDEFCVLIEKSPVMVFGITDYFSFESFNLFTKRFNEMYPKSEKRFFFNLELRLNETVNKTLEEVNVHLIFNPSSLDKVEKFLSKLDVVKTGKDETPISCLELNTNDDYKSATVTRASITKAFEETYGKKANRQEHFLVVTAANNDGLRPERGKKRKEGICDEIDKFSDAFFGGVQNVTYYLDEDRFEDKTIKAGKKPTVSGSDSHSFEDISNFLGKRVIEKADVGGKEKDVITKDVTWIKADPTYEGLRQITYEPDSGERIVIGPSEPDTKDDYKIIRKIKFNGSIDFPEEILFNNNLCSIVGSRSSGKSALLAYIAHSIEPAIVEGLIDGPGEGEEYRWQKIKVKHEIEWANGDSNIESPGSVVYVPQNYLYDKSKDAEEIKEKIRPVLFKTLPKFKDSYTKARDEVVALNEAISQKIEVWFEKKDGIASHEKDLKQLGDKDAIEKEKNKTDAKIKQLREDNKLSEKDVETYKVVTQNIATLNQRLKVIDSEMTTIGIVKSGTSYFNDAVIELSPRLNILPKNLQEKLGEDISEAKTTLIKNSSKTVLDYKTALEKEEKKTKESLQTIKKDNDELIKKYEKNTELEGLVKTLNGYSATLKSIGEAEEGIKKKTKDIAALISTIKESLAVRDKKFSNLVDFMKTADQSALSGIKFGIEVGIPNDRLSDLCDVINLKQNSDFVDKNQVKIEEIRKNPEKFLEHVYSGMQKITAHSDKETVCKKGLTLYETILFNAVMEGDKIGGFSESTMTPGKRALFALRLILEESDDTWPLLIDQPEDDLDSRSIYDEVVPFLKDKKKERQIIMVSHNANLVISSDSEQLIIANRHGSDRPNQDKKQFNYLTGSLENTVDFDTKCKDTLMAQGVCEHACSILDGGKTAFENRRNKYNL